MIYYAAVPKETYAAYPNAHAAEHDAALKLLGYALKKEYGIESLPEMTCGEHGKPYFKNADIKFNLSHCSGLAVCVVSSDEVGIDCEKTGRVSLKAAGRIFSPYENEMLEKLTGEEQARFSLMYGLPRRHTAKPRGRVFSAAFHSVTSVITFPNTADFILQDIFLFKIMQNIL